jgi:hypothetical protein
VEDLVNAFEAVGIELNRGIISIYGRKFRLRMSGSASSRAKRIIITHAYDDEVVTDLWVDPSNFVAFAKGARADLRKACL